MQTAPVRLQRPGAGLPFLEWAIARFWYFPRYSRAAGWEQNLARMLKESAKALAWVEGLDAEKLSRQVLIERIPGIEDSSRFWSAAMTLDHLMIVGRLMVMAIEQLSAGKVPGVEADVAKVKPPAVQHGPEILAAFREFLQDAEKRIRASAPGMDTRLAFPHPWFGPMTPGQWLWLMANHHGIHRRQIQAILKGMS
jgi:uncharacterized damage-inducible protein DinB